MVLRFYEINKKEVSHTMYPKSENHKDSQRVKIKKCTTES